MRRPRLYLANELGFSPEINGRAISRLVALFENLGYDIFQPFAEASKSSGKQIAEASEASTCGMRASWANVLKNKIGGQNKEAIRQSDVVVALLDGEGDPGVCSEVGFADGIGKRCYGIRFDVRDFGDFDGLPINLQTLFFIEDSGGQLFRSLDPLVKELRSFLKQIKEPISP